MTNKEISKLKRIILSLCSILIGLGIGASVISLRYDVEIRTDQLDLQAQVAEIIESKAVIDDLIQKLIFHIEQVKTEWRELRDLQIKLSKGE